MISASFRDSSPFLKLVFTIFTIFFGFILFMVLGILFAYIFFGTGIEALSGSAGLSNPKNIQVLKFLQAFFSIGLFVFPPFIIALFFHDKVGEYLKLNKFPSLHLLLLSIILVFISLPLVNFFAMINESVHFPESLKGIESVLKNMENEAQQTTESFLASSSIGNYLVNLLVIAFIPAIGEELLFRGIFQRLFHEWSKNIHLAIFLSAFLFSAMHLQFYGFIPRLLLGAMFGYILYWSQNLWLPIIAHFVNNSFAVTIYFIKGGLAQKAENIGTGSEMIPSLIISLVCLILILYMIKKSGNVDKNHLTNIGTN